MAYQNFYATKLQNSIGASDDTFAVQTIPTVTNGRLVLEPRNATQREIISFTGVSGTNLTGVTRGLFGTSAKPHPSGALVEMNFLAQDYTDLTDAFNSFAATNNDWRNVVGGVPVVTQVNANKEVLMNIPGDMTAILQPGHKVEVTRISSIASKALQLNGTNTQYLTKTNPTGLNGMTSGLSFSTIVNFSKYTNGANANTIIVSRLGTWLLYMTPTGRLDFYVLKDGSNTSEFVTYESIPLNRDVQIGFRYDAPSTTATLYIDGHACPASKTNAGTGATSVAVTGDLTIGKWLSTEISPLGTMGYTSLWNTAINENTYRAAMFRAVAAGETNLVGAWRFDNSYNDITTNANHFTPIGSPVFVDKRFFKQKEYGVIGYIGAFSGGVTPVSVYTGRSNSIPMETLGAMRYSAASSPYGFPTDKNNWTIKQVYRMALTSGFGAGQVINLYGMNIQIPAGAFTVRSISGATEANRGAGSTAITRGSISATSTDIELDNSWVNYHGSNVATILQIIPTQCEKEVTQTTSTPQYVTFFAEAGGTGIGYRGDLAGVFLSAELQLT